MTGRAGRRSRRSAARRGSPAPIVPTRRGASFAAAAVALWASWFLVGLRDLWYLAAVFAALVLVAGVFAAVRMLLARPEIRVTVSNPTPEVGTAISLAATVRSRVLLRSDAEILWEIDGERLAAPLAASGAGSAAPASVEWIPPRRGPVRLRAAALASRDPLGLVSVRARIRDGGAPLLVLPRPLAGFGAILEEEGEHGADRIGSRLFTNRVSGSPGGAVREYRSGDAPREIHWKQSARQRQLLVRLQEHADRGERALLLDRAPDAYRDASEFDTAVSAAVSLARHWLGTGHAVRLHLGAVTELCTGEGEMLRALAHARLDTDARRPEEPDAPGAVITGTVTESLLERLRRAPNGGTVWVLHGTSEGSMPEAWRARIIPAFGDGAVSAPARRDPA